MQLLPPMRLKLTDSDKSIAKVAKQLGVSYAEAVVCLVFSPRQ